MTTPRYVIRFQDLRMSDVDRVGGKNASLGEMVSQLAHAGIRVPGGFATTAEAYNEFLSQSGLKQRIDQRLAGLDTDDVQALARCGAEIRQWIEATPFPPALEALGVLEKHHYEVFAAIHEENQQILDRQGFLDWAAKKGIDRKKLEEAYDSFAVNTKTQRAIQNFPVSGLCMPPAFIRAVALIKECAAEVNARLDEWAKLGAIRYEFQAEPNAQRARNHAIAEARCGVLLFLDDDVLLEPGMMAAHLANYADPGLAAVCGYYTEPGEVPLAGLRVPDGDREVERHRNSGNDRGISKVLQCLGQLNDAQQDVGVVETHTVFVKTPSKEQRQTR